MGHISRTNMASNRHARLRRAARPLRFEPLEQRQLLASDILFADPVSYPTGDEPTSVDVADFDGDGQLDLVVANAGSDSLTFLRGTSDGRFERPWADVRVRTRPLAVATGDLDQDGFVDVVTANEGSNRVYAIYGQGNGEFERPRSIRLSGLHESIALADLNEDGRLDVLVTTNGTVSEGGVTDLEPGVTAIFASDDPSDSDGFERPESMFRSTTPVKVIASDLNGDSHLDVAIAHEAFFTLGEDNVTLVNGRGDGTFGFSEVLKAGGNPQSLESADLNGDGQSDLIVVNHDTIGVFLNQRGGSFAPEVTYVVGKSPRSVTAADLDADGDLDLAVTNFDSESISILANRGDGTLTASGRFQSGTSATSIVSADFNADELPDLAMVTGEAGEVVVLLNTSTDLPDAVSLDGSGDRYHEDFDTALAASDGPGARLPIGWSATVAGDSIRYVTQQFPPSSPAGILSAGPEAKEDRTLATGVSSAGQNTEFVWTARVDNSDVQSFRLNFDIEAWSGYSGEASGPGEASFNVVLEADSGQGFETIHDLGLVTTGQVLNPPTAPAGVELWKTDGTNVTMVSDIVQGRQSSSPSSFAVFDDELYFVAGDLVDGNRGIYKTDGSQVVEVAEIPCAIVRRGANCSTRIANWVLSDALYYELLQYPARDVIGPDMFAKIDSAGMTIIPNKERHNFFYQSAVYKDEIFVVPEHDFGVSDLGRELWRFDGEKTVLVEDINAQRSSFNVPGASSTPGDFVEYRGELYFTAGPRNENEREVWKTDGTTVELLTDIYPGTPSDVRSQVGAEELTVIDDVIYFIGDDDAGDNGSRELWKFDGNEAVQIADIYPGKPGAFGQWGSERSAGFTGFHGEVYFVADDGQTGAELWKTDGSTATRVTDINPGAGDSLSRPRLSGCGICISTSETIYERPIVAFNDGLYFAAKGATGGFGLWKTDGETVSELANLNPEGDFLIPSPHGPVAYPNFSIFNDELYFLADDGQTGVELWKTNGSDVIRVTDVNAGPADSFYCFSCQFTELNGEFYFAATNGDGQAAIIDGNAPANRFQFDSGPVSASIPEGSTIRLRFTTPNAVANVGYVYGLDNFEFRVLAAGDANADGEFNQLDVVAVLQPAKYLTGRPATFAEGDFTGDGLFDQQDVVAALQTGHYLQGPFALRTCTDHGVTRSSKRLVLEVGDGDLDGEA